jgi:dTDP-4-dehydrorhamnose reductase
LRSGAPSTPAWTEATSTDADAVAKAVAGHDVVVNCAAWTAVDAAEASEADAFEINATAAGLLARAAHSVGALMVHVSTDYVFGGDARAPYDEDAPLSPHSAYGRTKAAGEWAVRAEAPGRHLVVRTGWLYGAHGACFPRTIARVARERGSVEVVDDQVGQPTWTRDVADLIVRLVDASAPAGTWHATSGGETTWYAFAREVVAAAGHSPEVVTPTHSGAFKRDAARPAYSVLGHDRLTAHGLEPIGPWQERWSAAASEILAVDELQ